jgi:hypothetical protein
VVKLKRSATQEVAKLKTSSTQEVVKLKRPCSGGAGSQEVLLVLLKERVSRGWSSREMVRSSQGSHHGTSTESRRHAQACETRRLSGPVASESKRVLLKGIQGASRNALMDRWIDHAERDGGCRVDVSMIRMAVTRGSVSMSRIVHLLVCGLCWREVRLQREAE